MLVELMAKLGYRPLGKVDNASRDIVDTLAKEGLNLPVDYAAFLRTFPLSGVFQNEIVFQCDKPSPWADSGFDSLNALFAHHTSTSNDLLKVRETFLEELPTYFLIIGEVEGSSPLCLDTRKQSLGDIYIWNRESQDISAPALFLVCHGFSEFLQRLQIAADSSLAASPKLIEFSLSDELRAKAAELLAKRAKEQ